MSFVDSYLEHTKLYESPKSFWLWSAYAAIAGVLRDNIWIKDGDGRLYPNIYVLFIAGSAQKKGRPITTSSKLVYEVGNVNVISGRTSIQAILMEIGHTETDKTTGKIKKGGSAIFFAPELSAGIVADDQAIQILTDIYDYSPIPHITNLVGRGKTKLEKVVFSMLAGSNEELLKDFINSKAIYGGLLGRIFLVMPSEFRPGNSFPLGDAEKLREIQGELGKIAELAGEIEFTEEGMASYAKWYIPFREGSRKVSDKTGVVGRLPTNVKKLAIILAANQLSMQVKSCHIDEAIEICIGLLPNYKFFAFSAGKSDIKEAGIIVFEALAKTGVLQYKELIRNHWNDCDPETFDKALGAFELAGIIQSTTSGSSRSFVLTAKGKEIAGRITEYEGEK